MATTAAILGVTAVSKTMGDNREATEILATSFTPSPNFTPQPTLAPTPAPTLGLYANVEVGSRIQFGGINWRVFEVTDGKALITSDEILSHRAYHPVSENITWEESDIRKYLNGSFLNNTFTAEERAMIAESLIVNNSNQWFGTWRAAILQIKYSC